MYVDTARLLSGLQIEGAAHVRYTQYTSGQSEALGVAGSCSQLQQPEDVSALMDPQVADGQLWCGGQQQKQMLLMRNG